MTRRRLRALPGRLLAAADDVRWYGYGAFAWIIMTVLIAKGY